VPLYRRLVDDGWLWELTAAGGSCALAIVLCVVLWRYDGRPEPELRSMVDVGITLGTVVALLATVSVAMAVAAVQECLSQVKWLWYHRRPRPLADLERYDQASRGSWGSLRLLLRLHVLRSPTATLGALLMIAHLVVVPLAQQSVGLAIEMYPNATAAATVPYISSTLVKSLINSGSALLWVGWHLNQIGRSDFDRLPSQKRKLISSGTMPRPIRLHSYSPAVIPSRTV
jgi:hypothetical protein